MALISRPSSLRKAEEAIRRRTRQEEKEGINGPRRFGQPGYCPAPRLTHDRFGRIPPWRDE